MKKFLTAILAVVMIASMASVAALAADPTFEIGAVTVEEGATEVTVPVYIKNMPEAGLTSVRVYLNADDGLTAKEGLLGDEQFQKNPLWGPLDAEDITFSFIDGIKNVTGDGKLCEMIYTLPADAKVGDSWNIVLTYKAGDTFDADFNEIAFACVDGTVTVVEKAIVTTAPATETTAPATETTAPATEATEATEAPATSAAATETEATKAPAANNGGSAATGDMVFVVLAVMVVALGAAIVVKKVNVK